MRDAVSRALKNTRFARELAAKTRARARDRFHPRAIAQRHLQIYREVLERR
jgi:glycosyltransferase involved in cell wall biosynthesis